jgi:FtsZ-binding cell division protein ZapB
VEEVQVWIGNVQLRLTTTDSTIADGRTLENQLGRNQVLTIGMSMNTIERRFQVLQQEIRDMQTTINRLNKDVVDLTQDADENLARQLCEQMRNLNENWSHMISSSKVYSQHIQVC